MNNVDLYWFSGTGNTLLVTRAMRDEFVAAGINVNLARIEDTDAGGIDPTHTIGIAVPVACQSTYPLVWNFIRKLPKTNGTEIFLADTLGQFSGGIIAPMGKIVTATIEGDVHKGTNRQVSIISNDHIQKFIELTSSRKPEFGEFAENITLESVEENSVRVFDRFITDNIELEVTQIGKPFHDKFRELGNYVMPRVGIFCRVIKAGKLTVGEVSGLYCLILSIISQVTAS